MALATVLLAAACIPSPDAPPDGSAPGAGAGGGGSDGGGGGAGDAATPEPGRTVTTSSEFDREPCAAASVAEIRDALAVPFDVIAANVLVPEASPAVIDGDDAGPGGAAGCEYRLIAENTDTSESYHLITVRVVRLESGGPELMSACQAASAAAPLTYRVLDLADGACVGEGAVLSLLVGSAHYAITTAAVPGRADQTDEDLRLGTLSEAAGTVLAARLPAS